MRIRNATHADLNEIFDIYARARGFMKENSNPNQWGDTYPPEELILSDLNAGALYVLEASDGTLAGVFAFFSEGDPVYDNIDGKWLNNESYVAVHRVASSGTHKGVFGCVVEFCQSFSNNIKIDTHTENTVMQSVLKKHGFVNCGTVIYDGVPFLVFHFCKNGIAATN